MIDLDARLRSTFTHVAEDEPVPPLPDFSAELDAPPGALASFFDDAEKPVTSRRVAPRRRTAAGIAALAVLGGGLSIAAAAGLPVLPRSVVQALGWVSSPGAYNADPTTARLLLTEPGPGGETLRLFGARANDGGYCVTFTAEVIADPNAPGGYRVNPADTSRDGVFAASCGGLVGDKYWKTFGGQQSGSCSLDGPTTFVIRAPGTAAVKLQFDDGTARKLPVGGGYTAGWMTNRETHLHPILLGLDRTGATVASYRFNDLDCD